MVSASHGNYSAERKQTTPTFAGPGRVIVVGEHHPGWLEEVLDVKEVPGELGAGVLAPPAPPNPLQGVACLQGGWWGGLLGCRESKQHEIHSVFDLSIIMAAKESEVVI